MTATLLTDKTRLPEVYKLRVTAWENSDRKSKINKKSYPNGWFEEIDKNAYHFVVFDCNDGIIASARLSLHVHIDELPCPSSFIKFELPISRPFAFYSRLVVAPDYRNSALLKQLDYARLKFLKENKIPFSIATCKERRLKSLLENGFQVLGKTVVEYAEDDEEIALILTYDNINLNLNGQQTYISLGQNF